MASDISFVEYVCEQIGGAGDITYLKMFGEFGVYCDGKIIGLICDNRFFLKETEKGRSLLSEVVEAPPYPGAKLYFAIEDLDDTRALADLVRATYDELPAPKPKKKRTQ